MEVLFVRAAVTVAKIEPTVGMGFPRVLPVLLEEDNKDDDEVLPTIVTAWRFVFSP